MLSLIDATKRRVAKNRALRRSRVRFFDSNILRKSTLTARVVRIFGSNKHSTRGKNFSDQENLKTAAKKSEQASFFLPKKLFENRSVHIKISKKNNFSYVPKGKKNLKPYVY